MDALISTFHIDLSLMTAQLVNFLIVLGVLYQFAYKPILKILNERTEKIEKGLKDADVARKSLEMANEKEKEILNSAKKEARAILDEAGEAAKKIKEEIIFEAKNQSEQIQKETERKVEEEKIKMLKEVKGEIASLVVMATEKIIQEKLDENKDALLIQQSLK